jgi:hypothetical protein
LIVEILPTQTYREEAISTRLTLVTAMVDPVTKLCSLLVIVQTARMKVVV